MPNDSRSRNPYPDVGESKASASDPYRTSWDGRIGQQQYENQHQRVVQSVPERCSAVTVTRTLVPGAHPSAQRWRQANGLSQVL